jgi:hypothetical protein
MIPIYALCLNNNSNKQTSTQVANFEGLSRQLITEPHEPVPSTPDPQNQSQLKFWQRSFTFN